MSRNRAWSAPRDHRLHSCCRQTHRLSERGRGGRAAGVSRHAGRGWKSRPMCSTPHLWNRMASPFLGFTARLCRAHSLNSGLLPPGAGTWGGEGGGGIREGGKDTPAPLCMANEMPPGRPPAGRGGHTHSHLGEHGLPALIGSGEVHENGCKAVAAVDRVDLVEEVVPVLREGEGAVRGGREREAGALKKGRGC